MIIRPYIKIQIADRLISYSFDPKLNAIIMFSRTRNELGKEIAIFKRSKNGTNKQVDTYSETSY